MHTTPDTTPARPTNRTQTPTRDTPPEAIVRAPTDRAPQTFTQDRSRLQNLIDEFNVGFANADSQ